jgi:photosynthetic reaction center cytochrome c subunit
MVQKQNLRFGSLSCFPVWFPVTTRIKTLSCLFFIVIALACVPSARPQATGDTSAKPVIKSTAVPQSSEPTGADRCLFCHADEVQGYAQSSMAHALRRAGKEPDGTVSAHGSKITMHSSPTGFWQTWENAGDKREYRVDYVIGSGEHASGYLVDIGGHLFQSPVAYYKSRQSYDLAPGYENQPDPDFTRPVSEECVLCHSGTALYVPGTLNQYRSPAFPEEGITCDRCHGPAEKHLADPRAGTIINPTKLQPAARDSVCEQCHLFGVARVPNPGKKISDFVPGMPLEDTFTIYRNVMPEGLPAGDFKVISHVEQLALSSCARNSGGRMWCATCHNPHEKLVQSVEYYRSRCLSCHTTNFPASHPAKNSDCLGCHMPRRDAKDGGHTVFTDHRIQRFPETPIDLPASSGIAAWREPSSDLQKRNLGIAYIDVGMQRHSAPFVIQGYRNLAQVQEQFVNDGDFFKWIGEALLLGKQTSDAKLAFERALQLDPNSALTEASAASPYIQEGDDTRAIAHLERAVALDPLFLPAASTLIGLYEKNRKVTEAAKLSARIKTTMDKQSETNQTSPITSAKDSQKTTEEVFKNIEVLKGIPSDELIPAMQFMASSLGVECSFCHVEDHFEKDDKKPKQTARKMLQMMFALNKTSFEGQREVTCYSCHRGATNPVGTPIIESDVQYRPAPSETLSLPTNLPPADQILDKYVEALGGAATIQKITSRAEKGVTTILGKSVGVEVFTQTPEKWALVRHLPEGDSVSVLDGHAGWFGIAGRPTRDMHHSDIDAARMDADLQFALHIQQVFPELRVEYPEKIGDRETYVLFAIREGEPAAKFYFDEQSGLLVRIIRYGESPLGLNPSQIDYADYRDVEGVQVPFRVTFSQPGNSSTIQFEEIRQNVQIDDTKFAKPLADHSVAPKHW